MRSRGDRALRDALRDGLALEVVEPTLKTCAVVAGRALREGGGGGEEGSNDRAG